MDDPPIATAMEGSVMEIGDRAVRKL